MVLGKKNYGTMDKTMINFTENHGTLIFYRKKNYGTMEKPLLCSEL